MDHLKFALRYIALGWPVLPLHGIHEGVCGCGRAVCTCQGRCEMPTRHCSSPGKHPVADYVRRGLTDATLDEDTVRQWWATYPEANVGIATGEISGLMVLDIDPDHGGTRSMQNLEETHGEIEPTPLVHTGSGGLHVYFAMPTTPVGNSAGRVGPGIDIRGVGGYVVAPPSIHATGRRYEWEKGRTPRDIALAYPPDWLVKRLVRDGGASSGVSEPLPERIPNGQRNVMLTSAAGSMRRRGFSQEAIEAALRVENRLKCDPPLADYEVLNIARSISRPQYAPNVIANGGKWKVTR